MDAALEASTMRKVYLRLLPFAMLCYILAYLDRINGSFAALTMRGDLGMSYRFGQPVSDLLLQRLPATLELSLVSIVRF